MTSDPREMLEDLLAAAAEGTLSEAEAQRLEALLNGQPELQDLYARYMALHAWLAWERPGRQVLLPEPALASGGRKPPGGSVSDVSETASHVPYLTRSSLRVLLQSAREFVWHPMAAVLLVGLISTAIIIYQFSTAPTRQPVAVKPPIATPAEPAATLTGATDAQWLGEIPTQGDALPSGQRLVLERGSAMVAFSSQARVVFDAPVQFAIVDKGACRLVSGKLTAHVPEPAKGFQVQTPTGTITDLGTEFGVYVREARGNRLEARGEEEQEQPPPDAAPQDSPQPPMTEVHVFQGRVELAQAPSQPSSIPHPTSTILQAGQAATISDNKVEPLPTADPFKFALDKLQGNPRKVLLSDDFETYELGNQVQAIGPWVVQSGTRKGQGVSVIDPVERIAQSNAEGFAPLAPPPSLVGRRVAFIGASAPNPPDTFPLLAREIDGRLLAQNCQVLLEFDVFLHGVWFQHSLALATEIGHTSGIEFWRDTDAAKKVDVAGLNWYRLRVLLDVANGAPRDVRVERSLWRGPDGWVRDLSFQPPLPKLDWSTPPRYVIFGYPVVTSSTPAGVLWIDNVRMEVITEK